MYTNLKNKLLANLKAIKETGLYRRERVITTPQDIEIGLTNGQKVLNFCANNYLGLSNHPRIIASAKQALDSHGFGLSSVRFICGTQNIHKQLEQRISAYFHTDDTILYSSCYNANYGLFEILLGREDAAISDQLNHASIIDGIRLSKAKRYRYKHNDIADLERCLKDAEEDGARTKIVATDGVFSMDGDIAKLDDICRLADTYSALVMIDDCHGTGVLGAKGRGTMEYRGVDGRVDIITSTLGKALGGALGGFTTGRQEIIDILRQKSRPYLFSNTLAPPLVAAGLTAFELLPKTTHLRQKLMDNAAYFRSTMRSRGFAIPPGRHPIVPVMLYSARLAQRMAKQLLEEGIYVIGFFYPVVPKGEARIRVQLSACHSNEQIDKAVAAFTRVGKKLKVIQ